MNLFVCFKDEQCENRLNSCNSSAVPRSLGGNWWTKRTMRLLWCLTSSSTALENKNSVAGTTLKCLGLCRHGEFHFETFGYWMDSSLVYAIFSLSNREKCLSLVFLPFSTSWCRSPSTWYHYQIPLCETKAHLFNPQNAEDKHNTSFPLGATGKSK